VIDVEAARIGIVTATTAGPIEIGQIDEIGEPPRDPCSALR
jgi:hypothetical protein